ncbi:hypothetical protein Btru_051403 [Bulinus truncatus]|nr:hypothetical protein Btru_051403 [Bulinus truncatus]
MNRYHSDEINLLENVKYRLAIINYRLNRSAEASLFDFVERDVITERHVIKEGLNDIIIDIENTTSQLVIMAEDEAGEIKKCKAQNESTFYTELETNKTMLQQNHDQLDDNKGIQETQQSCLQEIQESGLEEIQELDLQEIQESGLQEIQESGLQEIQESGLQEIQESGLQEIKKSGLQEIQESGLQEIQESGLKEIKKSGLREVLESGLREVLESGIQIKKSGLQEVLESGVQIKKSGLQEIQKSGLQEVLESGVQETQESEGDVFDYFKFNLFLSNLEIVCIAGIVRF